MLYRNIYCLFLLLRYLVSAKESTAPVDHYWTPLAGVGRIKLAYPEKNIKKKCHKSD